MNIYFTRRTFVVFEQNNFAYTVCMFIYVETSNDFGFIKKKLKDIWQNLRVWIFLGTTPVIIHDPSPTVFS